MLLRRHIGRLLSDYYAQPSHKVVGSVSAASTWSTQELPPPRPPPLLRGAPPAVDFASLWGEWHWKRVYRRLYDRQEGQWLTPVELFRPYYSRAVADFVVRASRSAPAAMTTAAMTTAAMTTAVDVVEYGGGRGTNAHEVLTYLRNEHPDVYAGVRYTVVDSSETLHELQRSTLMGGADHADKVALVRRDVAAVAEGTEPLPCFHDGSSSSSGSRSMSDDSSSVATVAIGLELLDNLPHDKVWADPNTGNWMQAHVSIADADTDTNHAHLEERFIPLADPLLRSVLDAAPSYAPLPTRRRLGLAHSSPGPSMAPPRWVPTAACGLIRRILDERPNCHLLFADFDWLPLPDLSPLPPIAVGAAAYANANANANTDVSNGEYENTRNRQKLQRRQQMRRSKESIGEPLVTDMRGIDHECYLSAPKHCDILFPTDFESLAEFVRACSRHRSIEMKTTIDVHVMKQSDFLWEYGKKHVEETRSAWTGYTPLLHDFANCSVLLATPVSAAKRFLEKDER